VVCCVGAGTPRGFIACPIAGRLCRLLTAHATRVCNVRRCGSLLAAQNLRMKTDLTRVHAQVQAMIEGLIASIPNVIVAIVVLLIFLALARLAKNFAIRTGRHYRRSYNLGLIMGRLLEWVIGLTGGLVAISVVAPSFQTKDLINMLGIGGLAIGFAFRDIFQNFLAGIILLLTHPFEIGDQITVGSYEGTVDGIETRATTIRTYDGRRVVIPNSTIFAEPLSVNTAFGQLQSAYEIHIKAVQGVERARAGIRDTIGRVPGVLQDPPPEVLLSGFGDDDFTFQVRWWTSPRYAESLQVRDKVLAAIHQEPASPSPNPAMAAR
jgi:small conductance mechanosensitive channel